MPVAFICVLIFMAWFTYERKKYSRKDEEISQSFWDLEEKANHTRKKDISSIEFLSIDVSKIPLIDTNDEGILEANKRVLTLITNKMVDLSAYSNTELKLKYGVGNFGTLSEYDTNYTNFLMALSILAKNLFRGNYFKEAKAVYLLIISIGLPRVHDYVGLANTYLALDEPAELAKLISDIASSDLPRKEKVLASLKETLATYQ